MDVLLLNAFKNEVFNGLEIYAIKAIRLLEQPEWNMASGVPQRKRESSRERALKPKITFYTFEWS